MRAIHFPMNKWVRFPFWLENEDAIRCRQASWAHFHLSECEIFSLLFFAAARIIAWVAPTFPVYHDALHTAFLHFSRPCLIICYHHRVIFFNCHTTKLKRTKSLFAINQEFQQEKEPLEKPLLFSPFLRLPFFGGSASKWENVKEILKRLPWILNPSEKYEMCEGETPWLFFFCVRSIPVGKPKISVGTLHFSVFVMLQKKKKRKWRAYILLPPYPLHKVVWDYQANQNCKYNNVPLQDTWSAKKSGCMSTTIIIKYYTLFIPNSLLMPLNLIQITLIKEKCILLLKYAFLLRKVTEKGEKIFLM